MKAEKIHAQSTFSESIAECFASSHVIQTRNVLVILKPKITTDHNKVTCNKCIKRLGI